MTREQILKLFPNASEQFIKHNLGDKKARSRAKLQKPEVDIQEEGRDQVHRDKARKEKVDGGDHPRFRAAITLRVSDNYGRDGDGSESTILDCLIAAVRRLKAMDK